jgi:hypothetical protein
MACKTWPGRWMSTQIFSILRPAMLATAADTFAQNAHLSGRSHQLPAGMRFDVEELPEG